MGIITRTNFSNFIHHLFNIVLNKHAFPEDSSLLDLVAYILISICFLPSEGALWIGKFSNITSFSVNSRSHANMYPPGDASRCGDECANLREIYACVLYIHIYTCIRDAYTKIHDGRHERIRIRSRD